ncbi:MAG: enoyl-CoA hydratase/isomerase family protein [Deltaproteobacteria bacterium]|nr:enoyl-CoA hydratase/isomerase family protein [Deltaproteobacteria bacterium]
MDSKLSTVILEKISGTGVAKIIFNRPEKRNALNGQLVAEIMSALEEIRADRDINVVITKGNGPSYCSGLDLYFLRSLSEGPPGDWDRPTPTVVLFEAIRNFGKITIAQVHGYCLGGGIALMNSHDLVIAAKNSQIGMPEILRGSFGQMATSTLFHSGVPFKKAALIQLTGQNVSGAEADRLGLVSMAVEEAELEEATLKLAQDIATRHPAALANAKIAAQMGRDLSLPDAMKLDQLIGARQRLMVDPLGKVEEYLSSQKGGPNTTYRRSDPK